jgi:hypothetical protein
MNNFKTYFLFGVGCAGGIILVNYVASKFRKQKDYKQLENSQYINNSLPKEGNLINKQ